nr:MAG TPA: restriction alleviation protein [Caudoviricetes sp.]
MVAILVSPLLEWWLFWCATFCSLVVNQDLHLNRIRVKTSSPCPFCPDFVSPLGPARYYPHSPLVHTPFVNPY